MALSQEGNKYAGMYRTSPDQRIDVNVRYLEKLNDFLELSGNCNINENSPLCKFEFIDLNDEVFAIFDIHMNVIIANDLNRITLFCHCFQVSSVFLV